MQRILRPILSFLPHRAGGLPPLPATDLPYPHVHLLYWKPARGIVNFGDRLSEVLIRAILATRGRSLTDETAQAHRLMAIGSILHYAKRGDVIWGAGVNGKIDPSLITADALDIRMVRGPLSAEVLRKKGHKVADFYADPALILPHLLGDRFRRVSKRPYVLVPNFHDLSLVQNHAHVVSPLWGWNRVIESIISADFVIASSLHALIIAESFGIPARLIRLSDAESLFKYQDYYSATARVDFEAADSVPHALEMGGMPLPTIYAESILARFPWDLWGITA